jgi:hypothetical protein
MPRPAPGFNWFRFLSIAFNRLPIHAHWRNIPGFGPAHKWKTVFLRPARRETNFFFISSKIFILPQAILR